MAGRGGKNSTNVTTAKGTPKQGTRPAGTSAVVPNGQYPTIIGTHGLATTPKPQVAPGGGSVTVNSQPAKK